MSKILELKEKLNLENTRFFIIKTDKDDLEFAKSLYITSFGLNTPLSDISYIIQHNNILDEKCVYYFIHELKEETQIGLFSKFSYENIPEHCLSDIVIMTDNMINILNDAKNETLYELKNKEEKLEEEKIISRRELSINNTVLNFNSLLAITIEMTEEAKGFKSISSLIGRILGSRIGDDKNKPTWFVEKLVSGKNHYTDMFKYLLVIRIVSPKIDTINDKFNVLKEISCMNNIFITSDKYKYNIFELSREALIMNYMNNLSDLERMYTVYSDDAAPQFYNLIHLNNYADNEDMKLGIHEDTSLFNLVDNYLDEYTWCKDEDEDDATLLEINREEEKTESGERQDNKPIEPSEKDEVSEPANKDKVKVIMSNLTFVPGAQGLPQILMNEYIISINSYFEKLNISIPEVKFEVNNNSQYGYNGYINVATGVSVTLINPELSVLALYDFMKIYNLTNVHFCKED